MYFGVFSQTIHDTDGGDMASITFDNYFNNAYGDILEFNHYSIIQIMKVMLVIIECIFTQEEVL